MFWRTPFPYLILGTLALLAGLVIWDIRQPISAWEESCTVLATGPQVPQLFPAAPVVLNQGGPPPAEIALRCGKQGVVRLNDPDAFQYGVVEAGMPATLAVRHYHWLPGQTRISVGGHAATGDVE